MLRYNKNTMGTLTLCQVRKVTKNGELVEVVDEKGHKLYNKFLVEIRQGNCLAVFLYIYKKENPDDPEKCWVHQLVNFIGNEQHLKNIVKGQKKDVFKYMLSADRLEDIKLNLYYKECETILKYMVRDGLKVKCYYKEPKNNK